MALFVIEKGEMITHMVEAKSVLQPKIISTEVRLSTGTDARRTVVRIFIESKNGREGYIELHPSEAEELIKGLTKEVGKVRARSRLEMIIEAISRDCSDAENEDEIDRCVEEKVSEVIKRESLAKKLSNLYKM